MTSRRSVGVAIAALAMIFTLAACGRDDDGGGGASPGGAVSQAPEVDTGAASGEIDVWAMGTEGENLGVLAESFMADNPDITVTVTPVPWDAAHDRIVNAIAGGEVPDVTMVGTTWMGEFAALGGLDPTPSNIDGSQFFEGAWNTTVVDGTSYAVPWYVETRLLYYRTDLAEEGGVTEAPATWDDLKALAEGIQGAGAEYGINLQPGGTGSWQTFMPFFWQAGGEILGEDGAFTLDSEACVEALTFYDSFFEEGLTAPAAADVPLEGEFANGSVGSFVSGPWMIGIVTDAGADPETWTVAH
jgi:multiple sugar transport system substrate-binding protein